MADRLPKYKPPAKRRPEVRRTDYIPDPGKNAPYAEQAIYRKKKSVDPAFRAIQGKIRDVERVDPQIEGLTARNLVGASNRARRTGQDLAQGTDVMADPRLASALRNYTGARRGMRTAMDMMVPYATGERSAARDQAALQQDAIRRAMMSQAASTPGGGLAAMRQAMNVAGDSGVRLGREAALAAQKERLGAIGSLLQGSAQMGQMDISNLGALGGMANQAQANRIRAMTGMEGIANQALQNAYQEQARAAGMEFIQNQLPQQRDIALYNMANQQAQNDLAMQLAATADEESKDKSFWESIIGGVTGGIGGLLGAVF